MDMPASPIAFMIIDGVECRAIERTNKGLPTEGRAEIAVYIDEELVPFVTPLLITESLPISAFMPIIYVEKIGKQS